MQDTRREDIIFYLDIAKKVLRRRDLKKAIDHFIEEKKKLNPQSKFGLALIKEDGQPDLIVNKTKADPIIDKISDEWKSRPKDESYLENGLFFCLSQIAADAKDGVADHRIIVISDCPSNRNADYHNALFELIENVKFLPTYIDIVRVGDQRFYSDEVKLKIITSSTHGGLFYAEDGKDLRGVLGALTKSKRLAAANRSEGEIVIDESNKDFYENLANDLLTPEPGEKGTCEICKFEECEECVPEYSGFVKCFNCASLFHEEHLAKYAFENNVGLPHIFRCPKCDTLLKMEQERALCINGIDITEEDELCEEKDTQKDNISDEDLVPITEENELEIQSEQEAMEFQYGSDEDVVEETKEAEDNKRKSIPLTPSGVNFFQAPVADQPANAETAEASQSDDDKPETSETEPEIFEPEKPGTTTKKSERRRRRARRKVTLCPVCGSAVNASDRLCKNCGSPL